MNEKIVFKQKSSWNEVFVTWESQEGQEVSWQKHAQEIGWDSWRQWRSFISDQLALSSKDWNIYEIQDLSVVSDFLLGPFRGWQKHFESKLTHTFRDLVELHQDWVSQNKSIQNLIANFPADTQLIGLIRESDGKIMLYEGHHRCSALTSVLLLSKRDFPETKIKIALAVIPKSEEVALHRLLERGSTKQ